MEYELTFIPNDDKQGYPFCRLRLSEKKTLVTTSLVPNIFLANEFPFVHEKE